MKRIEFKLSMPNRGSWNGGWSGSKRNYIKVKNLRDKRFEEMKFENGKKYWSYNFGDGWCASIEGRLLSNGERAKKSDGFCGYDWMVDEIVWYDEIRGRKS